jgi:hypothetical protein
MPQNLRDQGRLLDTSNHPQLAPHALIATPARMLAIFSGE